MRDVIVRVDPDACVGSGLCQQIAAAVFDMRPDGVVALRTGEGPSAVPAELADRVREAELSCPAQAIVVYVSDRSAIDR
jgi:ferredoxin